MNTIAAYIGYYYLSQTLSDDKSTSGIVDAAKNICQLWQGLSQLKNNQKIADARLLGAISVVAMKQKINVAQLQHKFIKQVV